MAFKVKCDCGNGIYKCDEKIFPFCKDCFIDMNGEHKTSYYAVMYIEKEIEEEIDQLIYENKQLLEDYVTERINENGLLDFMIYVFNDKIMNGFENLGRKTVILAIAKVYFIKYKTFFFSSRHNLSMYIIKMREIVLEKNRRNHEEKIRKYYSYALLGILIFHYIFF